MKRLLASALAALMLAGCGGGGGSSVPASSSKTQAKLVNGSVVLSIPVASTTTQALKQHVRYPQFISPNASSVSLSINGGAATLFDVSTSSPLCTTIVTARNCTLSFGAPVGTDTFAFTIFSGANGTGSTLAVANSTQTIAAGVAFNFTVAMNASVGTITVGFAQTNNGNCQDAPMNFNGFNEGCAGTGPLTITVDDPSGAQITGSAPFATPLQITTNEPTITVSPTTMTAPNQTITMSYAGVPWQSITNFFSVSVSAGGQTGALLIPVEQSNLYVANSNAAPGMTPTGGGNIAVYRFGASGSATPTRLLSGANTQLNNPVQPLLDSSGNLWVLDNGPYTTHSNPVINVYAPGATGNVAPTRQITGIAALTSNQACEAMTFNPTGSYLYVSCDDEMIHVFVPSSGVQIATIIADSFEHIIGLAFDALGNLYVADPALSTIFYFSGPIPTSGSHVTIAPAFTMNGSYSWPSGDSPLAVAVDNAGTLYASVSYYNASSGAPDAYNGIYYWKTVHIPCNDCAADARLQGVPLSTHAPAGFTFDPPGNLYVGNPYTDQVFVYAESTVAGTSGVVTGAPLLHTINTGSTPGAPVGMAVGP